MSCSAGFSLNELVPQSETSAVRRLLQCTDLGVYTNDISAKFEGSGAADLSPEDFAARRNVVRQVTQWSKSMGGRGKPQIVVQNEWTPILYLYEARLYWPLRPSYTHSPPQIVKSAAKREVGVRSATLNLPLTPPYRETGVTWSSST
jgi:hypothetical protein